MAATATLLTSLSDGWDTANDLSKTTASITPGANCALVLLAGGVHDNAAASGLFENGGTTNCTVVSSAAGPTWTRQAFAVPANGFDSHT